MGIGRKVSRYIFHFNGFSNFSSLNTTCILDIHISFVLFVRIKAEAIESALVEQHKRLRTSSAIEREEAIAQALRVAKGQASTKTKAQVADAQYECQNIAEKMLEQQRQLHKAEIRHLNER